MEASDPPDARSRAALPPWAFLLVFAAAFVAHGSALGADWVGDDVALVKDGGVVSRGLAGAGDALGANAWPASSEPGVWRPVALLSLCLEAPLWREDGGGLDPFGFHLTNLLLHGAAAVLLLLLVGRLAPRRPLLAAGTAVVFAVHPLHASAVASLAGRADLLALLFGLVAVGLWLRAREGRPALLPLSALACFLALLSKETALGLPLVVLLLDATGVLPGRAPRGSSRAFATLVLLVPVALWFARWPGTQTAWAAGVEGLGRAVLAFLVPVDLVRDHLALTDGRTGVTVSDVAGAVGLAFLLAGLAAGVASIVRRTAASVAVSATAVAWIAAVAVAPAGTPLEAHFAYVTTPALFLVGGALLEVLLAGARGRARAAAGAAAAAAVLVALGLLCWREGAAHGDEAAWQSALVDRYPAHDSLLVRASRTLRERAEAERLRATERVLSDDERQALIARTTAWLEDAEAWSLAALRRADPEARERTIAADGHRELGFVLQGLARIPDSVQALREALRLEPGLASQEALVSLPAGRRRVVAETLFRLARGEESLGEPAKAAVHLEHAAELAPDDLAIQEAAGRTLLRAGEFARALRRLRRAAELASSPAQRERIERLLTEGREAAGETADRRLREARAAIEREEHAEALRLYETALAADPSLLRAYQELAFHLGQWYGRYDQAREVIGRARAVLRQAGYAPEDVWWQRLADLEARLERWEKEDLEDERED